MPKTASRTEPMSTKDWIVSMPIAELRAIARSTSPVGRFWQERLWARDELAHRNAKARGETP
jgi:hypothetical protein